MNEIQKNKEYLEGNIKKIHTSSLHKFNPLPKLTAISKKQPEFKIKMALKSGHRIFGENRVQEAEKRWLPFLEEINDLQLHLVGPLQTNKVKKALKLFNFIHSLDRESLALEISHNMTNETKTKEIFIQVNTGYEKQKSGIMPNEISQFYEYCSQKLKLPITGLMCIPPINEEPSTHFCYLHELSRKLNLKNLSMGMSSDYEIAIKFGATYLRLGTIFFGERQNQI